MCIRGTHTIAQNIHLYHLLHDSNRRLSFGTVLTVLYCAAARSDRHSGKGRADRTSDRRKRSLTIFDERRLFFTSASDHNFRQKNATHHVFMCLENPTVKRQKRQTIIITITIPKRVLANKSSNNNVAVRGRFYCRSGKMFLEECSHLCDP
jgi:hypothetical protein